MPLVRFLPKLFFVVRFCGRKIRGHWPKLVARALNANLGPLLIFAPRRAVAEDLARQLATELPPVETLELSHEQKNSR